MLEVAADAASDSKVTIPGPSFRSDAAVFLALGFTVFTLVTVFALGDSRFVTMPLPPGLHAKRIARGDMRYPHVVHYIAGLHAVTQLPDHCITPRLAAYKVRPPPNDITRNHDRVFSYRSHIKSCVAVAEIHR